MFGWKRKIEAEISNIYQILAQRDATFQSMTTNVASLRGLINRKLGGKNNSDEEQEDKSNSPSSDEIQKIIQMFGGTVPIELMEKFKGKQDF